MDRKILELVALGASYAVNCRPCLEHHKTAAAEAGLTREEMLEALRVAEAVRQGASRKTKEFADELFGPAREERSSPAGSACCT